MRAVFAVPVIATLAAAASPAFAQTQVSTYPRTPDTVIRSVRMTVDDLRRLKMEIQVRVARNDRLNAQFVQAWRDTSLVRERARLEDEMVRIFDEVLSKQRLLTLGCASLRPGDESTPGTLGLRVNENEAVLYFLQRTPGGQSLTMTFQRPPRIDAVESGSPAEKAGVHAGDVWIAINGKPLAGDVRFDELLTPGTPVTIRVLRDGREMDLPQVLVARKKIEYPQDVCDLGQPMYAFAVPLIELTVQLPRQTPARAGVTRAPTLTFGGTQTFVLGLPQTMAVYGGASLQPVDDEWRKMLGMQGDGLVIVDIAPGLSAEGAGLRKFDVIRQINGETVTSADAFRRIAAVQRTLVLTVFTKDGGTRTVTVGR